MALVTSRATPQSPYARRREQNQAHKQANPLASASTPMECAPLGSETSARWIVRQKSAADFSRKSDRLWSDYDVVWASVRQ
jgi:hypothetical protein